jgi:lipoprotein signal peptidase
VVARAWPAVGEEGNLRVLVTAAVAVFLIDLTVATAMVAGAGGVFYHPRSDAAGWVVLAAMAVLAAAILRIGCRALSLTGGILIGAGAGNFASALVWKGVPDYLAVGQAVFNVADAAAVVGGCAMILVALWLLGQGLRAS